MLFAFALFGKVIKKTISRQEEFMSKLSYCLTRQENGGAGQRKKLYQPSFRHPDPIE